MFTESTCTLSVRSLLLLFSTLCLIIPVSAQRGRLGSDTGDTGTGGNNAILGNVYYPSGVRVDRPIRVRLTTMTKGDIITMTDNRGSFSFRKLATGTYSVVIDGEKNYEPATERVDIIGRSVNSQEQIFTVQIKLKLKGGIESKPEVLNADFADVPKRALEFYKKALEEARAGKNKAAIEQLNAAIADYPGFMLAFNELGVQYLRLGQLEKANESLRSALKLAPDAFAPLMNHGMVLVLMKQYKEAEPELRSALARKEQTALAHYYLGIALVNLNRYDEAEKDLTRAVALGGDEVKEAHRYLAGIYNSRGDREHAIAELEIYLRIAPNSKDAEHIRQLIAQLRGSKPE